MANSVPVAIASNQGSFPVSITGTLPAGTNSIGAVTQGGTWTVTQSSGPWSVNATQIGGATLNLGQTTMSASVPVTIASNQSAITVSSGVSTSGGATAYSYIASGASNQDAQNVKSSAGQVYQITGFNTNSTPVYVKLYNGTSPTSASTPVQRLMIPGNTAGAGFVIPFSGGLAFSTAISHRITGALADNDTTAVSSGCVINLAYA
jgi:hypothetical protein